MEEIRTGRKKLAGQTIYKTAGTTDASSIKKIPGLTSENGSDMIRIVDVKNELVNGKASLLKQNTASPAFASTYRNPNIAQSGGDVNRNLLFQREASLLGIHNLSADNIRHALKMGGLANPSDTPKDVREALENAGLEVREYAEGERAKTVAEYARGRSGGVRLLFQQTEKELLDDAASFDSWQDFMEFYESFGKPEDSIVPSGADEAWYRTAWELARKRKAGRETGMTAEDRDALFIREMEDGSLEDFLTETLHFYIFYVKYGCNVVPI